MELFLNHDCFPSFSAALCSMDQMIALRTSSMASLPPLQRSTFVWCRTLCSLLMEMAPVRTHMIVSPKRLVDEMINMNDHLQNIYSMFYEDSCPTLFPPASSRAAAPWTCLLRPSSHKEPLQSSSASASSHLFIFWHSVYILLNPLRRDHISGLFREKEGKREKKNTF